MAGTIVIVEDNPDEAIIINRAVSKAGPGIAMEIKSSGRSVLEYLQNCTAMPFLILLDLNMPGMGGIDVLQKIRAHDRGRHVPVVVLTSSSLAADVDAAYKAGANGFVTKAHDLAEFTGDMKAVIHYWHDVNRPPR
jgi:CheY-like chemotaxis protein